MIVAAVQSVSPVAVAAHAGEDEIIFARQRCNLLDALIAIPDFARGETDLRRLAQQCRQIAAGFVEAGDAKGLFDSHAPSSPLEDDAHRALALLLEHRVRVARLVGLEA